MADRMSWCWVLASVLRALLPVLQVFVVLRLFCGYLRWPGLRAVCVAGVAVREDWAALLLLVYCAAVYRERRYQMLCEYNFSS